MAKARSAHESGQILGLASPAFFVDVHHVAGLVVAKRYVAREFVRQLEVLHCVLCREIGSGAVVVARRDLDLQVGITAHGCGEPLGHRHLPSFELLEGPGPHPVRQYLIRKVVFVFQFGAQIVVARGRVRSEDSGVARVHGGPFTYRVRLPAGKPPVQTANDEAAVAQQFPEEPV